MKDAVLNASPSTLQDTLKMLNEDTKKKLDADPTIILDTRLIECFMTILHRTVSDY
jgi:hypothetical protein